MMTFDCVPVDEEHNLEPPAEFALGPFGGYRQKQEVDRKQKHCKENELRNLTVSLTLRQVYWSPGNCDQE